LFITVHHF